MSALSRKSKLIVGLLFIFPAVLWAVLAGTPSTALANYSFNREWSRRFSLCDGVYSSWISAKSTLVQYRGAPVQLQEMTLTYVDRLADPDVDWSGQWVLDAKDSRSNQIPVPINLIRYGAQTSFDMRAWSNYNSRQAGRVWHQRFSWHTRSESWNEGGSELTELFPEGFKAVGCADLPKASGYDLEEPRQFADASHLDGVWVMEPFQPLDMMIENKPQSMPQYNQLLVLRTARGDANKYSVETLSSYAANSGIKWMRNFVNDYWSELADNNGQWSASLEMPKVFDLGRLTLKLNREGDAGLVGTLQQVCTGKAQNRNSDSPKPCADIPIRLHRLNQNGLSAETGTLTWAWSESIEMVYPSAISMSGPFPLLKDISTTSTRPALMPVSPSVNWFYANGAERLRADLAFGNKQRQVVIPDLMPGRYAFRMPEVSERGIPRSSSDNQCFSRVNTPAEETFTISAGSKTTINWPGPPSGWVYCCGSNGKQTCKTVR